MLFSLRHHIDAPVERVESAVLEPAYQQLIAKLPHVEERVVTEQEEREDGTVHRVVHYTLSSGVPRAVTTAIGTSSITWNEVGEFDPRAHAWTFRIVPGVFKGGFDARGSYRFVPDGGGCVREVEVDMRVKVPVVGRLVERAIRDGLVETMEAEARALAEYVRR